MDYSNFPFRTVDLGLDLRDVPDKVQEGKWVRLKNVRSTQEALLTTRKGRALTIDFGLPTSSVHSIKRLSSSVLLSGVGTALYANGTLYSGAATMFSGNPLSIIPFKPERGIATWGYIADSAAMKKVAADGRIYNWGISGPQLPATDTTSGTGGLDTSVPGAVGYDWRYTYYSTTTGAESNPSPIQAVKTTAVGVGANVSVTASTDVQVDTIRLYRRGGTIPAQWRLTASGPNLTGIIRDESSDEDISVATPLSVDNAVPFTSINTDGAEITAVRLPYATGPFLGKYILAVGDTNRPGFLYWTNAGNPDGASSSNNVQITPPTEPLINVCMYNGLAFTFSKDNWHAIDFGQQGLTFRGRKTAVGRGVVGPWAFAVGPEIYFVSKDGVCATDGESPARILTDEALRPLFQGLFVSNFAPIDFTHPEKIRLHFAEQELHFVYQDTLGSPQHLTFHVLYERWKSSGSTLFSTSSIYSDENSSSARIFIGGTNGKLYEESGTTDAGSSISLNARTGSLDIEAPQTVKEWGNVILDADPGGGTITLTPYIDAESYSLTPIVLTGSGRQKFARSLSDTFGHSIAFDFAWDGAGPTIYQFSVLYRMDKEAVRHWEFPPTSHGLSGWQHLRDGYITARTQAELTFTVEVDGVAYSPVFRTSSNTGGDKEKLYFDMPPVKGKLFRYIINSTADFRLYGEDCEVRTKPWNTSLGYQLVSPFRKEG